VPGIVTTMSLARAWTLRSGLVALAMQSYSFFGLLAFAVDLMGRFDPILLLPFSALVAAAGTRISDLSVSALSLCAGLLFASSPSPCAYPA